MFFKNDYNSFNRSILSVVSKIKFDDADKFYIPQGICYVDGYFLITCYDGLKINNSVIYIYKDCNFYKKVYLDCKIHGGGICYHRKSNSIFITGKGSLNKSYVNKYDFKLLFCEDKDYIVTKKFIV